jgi:hypothetical protein
MKRKLTDSESSQLKKRVAEIVKADELKTIGNFEYDNKKFFNIVLKPSGKYVMLKTMQNNGYVFNSDDDIEVCIGVKKKKKDLTCAKIIFFVVNREEKKATVFVKWYFKKKELVDNCRKKVKTFAKDLGIKNKSDLGAKNKSDLGTKNKSDLGKKNKSEMIFQSEMLQEIPIESVNRKVNIGHIDENSVNGDMCKFEKVYSHYYDYKKRYLAKFDPNKNVSIIENPFYYYEKMRNIL